MVGDGFLNLWIVFAYYDYVTGLDDFLWRVNHQRRDMRYCLFDVALVRTDESAKATSSS